MLNIFCCVTMQTLLFASLATVAASSAHVTPHEKINQHVALVYKLNGTEHVKQSDAFTTKGSMVYIDSGAKCDGKVSSGFGFTLGACVVRDNEGSGVIYESCYQSGSKIQFTFTECEDEYCTKGCKSYQLSEETCDTDPVEPYNGAVSCTSNEDAFHNFDELTLHTTRFYEENDAQCQDQYGYWSSIAMSCTSSYDRHCSPAGHYSYNTKCEM